MSSVSEAGRAIVAKSARGPKAFGSDHCSALLNDRPRTSKLEKKGVFSGDSHYTLRGVYIRFFICHNFEVR